LIGPVDVVIVDACQTGPRIKTIRPGSFNVRHRVCEGFCAGIAALNKKSRLLGLPREARQGANLIANLHQCKSSRGTIDTTCHGENRRTSITFGVSEL
jgi:hypothetical protein